MNIEAAEVFMKNATWRCWHLLLKSVVGQPKKDWYGFKSWRAYPRMQELAEFEKDLAALIQRVKHKPRSNKFLDNLSKIGKEINGMKDLIISADKTNNKYLVPATVYNTLKAKQIEKSYKKAGTEEVESVTVEHSELSEGLGIDERIFRTVR